MYRTIAAYLQGDISNQPNGNVYIYTARYCLLYCILYYIVYYYIVYYHQMHNCLKTLHGYKCQQIDLVN